MMFAVTNVHVNVHQAEVQRYLYSPAGPVHRLVGGVTRKTEAIAKATVDVDTGRLKGSGKSEVHNAPGAVVGRVEFTARHALPYHQGHGVIRPKRGKYLVFRVNGQLVFAREVRAVKGKPFLVNALKAASPWPVTIH